MVLAYGLSSTSLTYVHKKIYANFGEEISPGNILHVACLLNVLVCTALMTYKEFRKESLVTLRSYGITIPELNKILDKSAVGIRFGLANFLTVMFSLSALKLTSIPL